MFKVNIIGTGSSGNCIVIDDHLVIDCGLPAKSLMPALENNLEALIITHRHGDHLGLSFLKALYKVRPWLVETKLYTNQDVKLFIERSFNSRWSCDLSANHVITQNDTFEITTSVATYKVTSFKLYHDVENYGFVIEKDGAKLVFATDTSSLRDAPVQDYDYIVVEGNYDEDKIMESILSEDPNESYRAGRNFRHLSVQQFEKFVRMCSKPETKVYQLHESGQYGVSSAFGLNNK
jgi:phosphoribosyl 1,2-cyclic phosphodiesterase